MIEFGAVFLYTPFPWLVVMYVVAYRHDIGRFGKPLRDSARRAEWWSVCRHLKLTDDKVSVPPDNLGRWSWAALVATILISFLWALVPFSLSWYKLAALQAAAALPLFLVLASNFGPFPYKPYKDFLPYPRRGTRARHIERRKRDSSGTSAPATEEGEGRKAP